MKQAILTGPKRFDVHDAAMPPVGVGDVLVRVAMCGVCASELHAWEEGEDAPLALGHEVAGEVVAVGAEVRGFTQGDHVTGLFRAGFADHAAAPADKVIRLTEGIGLDHAFGEPLACAVSAALRTKVELGDRIAIVGLGVMGLLMLQLLKLKRPSFILGADLRDDALASGRRLGADVAIHPDAIAAGDKRAWPIDRPGNGNGFDVVVEATGTPEGLTLAGELAREHGVLSILGYHQGGPRQVDMQLWNYKALEVLNAHERRPAVRMDCMRRGLVLAAAGKLDLRTLPTHHFSLEEVGAGFAALESKPPGFIKSVVMFDDVSAAPRLAGRVAPAR